MRLIPISAKKMCKLLKKLGFVKTSQRGSHARFKHPDGRKTMVPMHSRKELQHRLIIEILSQINLERKDFDKLRT